MMVRKTYLLLNMAIVGIYVRFHGGFVLFHGFLA